MSFEMLLFILRIVGGLLLLAFLGTIAWFLYRDSQLAAQTMRDRLRRYGWLRLLPAEDEVDPDETRYPLLPVTSLGRAPGNTVVVNDSFASAEHALLTLRGRQWWLEDLGSRNGTRLNESPVDGGTVVSAGDVIGIGQTRLKIELE